MNWKQLHLSSLVSIIIIVIATFVTLFQHWEMTHETWQYWFFARVFAETGQFIIPDRSPIYILYLQLFRPLRYPNMVTAEYMVTTVLSSLALVMFLKRYMPILVATMGVILWMPYFQISEPSVQKLALSFCLIAFLIRKKNTSRTATAWSYVFLIGAYLLRSNYVVVLLLVFIRDLITIVKTKKILSFRIHIKSDWPVFAAVLFLVAVHMFQSPHPWNNVWGATTTWFPSNGKTFNILQNYNASFILERYGQYQDHDFYESNTEVFGGADTTYAAITANPDFFRRVAWEYTKVGLANFTNLTQLPAIFTVQDTNWKAHLFIVVFIFIGAFIAVARKITSLYVLGVVGMVLLTFLFLPNKRYFIAVIPVTLMSAGTWSWVGVLLLNAFLRAPASLRLTMLKIVYPIATTACVILFSMGPTSSDFSGVFAATWTNLIKTVAEDYKSGKLRALEFRDTSIYFPPVKSAYTSLVGHLPQCRGIMTLENTFIGAYTDYPIEKIYDIWEIPPFGRYEDYISSDQSGPHLRGGDGWGGDGSEYQGLRPERINCLFISKNLKYGVGAATNSQIRYENYIAPYAKQLESRGAKKYFLDGYGEAIVYR